MAMGETNKKTEKQPAKAHPSELGPVLLVGLPGL